MSASCHSRPVSRLTLLFLPCLQGFSGIFAYILLLDFPISLIALLGRVRFLHLLSILAGLDLFIFLLAIHNSFRAKCTWATVRALRKLLRKNSRIRHLREKTLAWQNGAWEYTDDDWFIRVSQDSACILFAPELDLSYPGLHTIHVIYDDAGRRRCCAPNREYDVYSFRTQVGSSIAARTDRSAHLLKWIQDHGGRTIKTDVSPIHRVYF